MHVTTPRGNVSEQAVIAVSASFSLFTPIFSGTMSSLLVEVDVPQVKPAAEGPTSQKDKDRFPSFPTSLKMSMSSNNRERPSLSLLASFVAADAPSGTVKAAFKSS